MTVSPTEEVQYTYRLVSCSVFALTEAVTIAQDMSRFRASWAEVGGTGRLVCRVRAAPPPNFVWSSSSDLILLNSDKYTIHEPQVTVSRTVHSFLPHKDIICASVQYTTAVFEVKTWIMNTRHTSCVSVK